MEGRIFRRKLYDKMLRWKHERNDEIQDRPLARQAIR